MIVPHLVGWGALWLPTNPKAATRQKIEHPETKAK
jgi:hypothetical protein